MIFSYCGHSYLTDADYDDNWCAEQPRAPFLDAVNQNSDGEERSFEFEIHAAESDRELSEGEVDIFLQKREKQAKQIERERKLYKKIRGEPVYESSPENSADE